MCPMTMLSSQICFKPFLTTSLQVGLASNWIIILESNLDHIGEKLGTKTRTKSHFLTLSTSLILWISIKISIPSMSWNWTNRSSSVLVMHSSYIDWDQVKWVDTELLCCPGFHSLVYMGISGGLFWNLLLGCLPLTSVEGSAYISSTNCMWS